jgi:hypothetical protein
MARGEKYGVQAKATAETEAAIKVETEHGETKRR